MNRKLAVLLAALSLLLGVMTVAVASGPKMPEPEDAGFWAFITKVDPYTKWDIWPGQTGIKPGNAPHGAFVKIYANAVAITAVKVGKPMPHGAIIVKENYGKDKTTLMAVTPIYKYEGYNPDAADWLWGKYGPDGKVMAAGKPKGCIACHRAMSGKDWIFTETK